MNIHVDKMQEELLKLLPESIDFYSQRNEILSECYSVEDILVMLFILNYINTEKMAVAYVYLFMNGLCNPLDSGRRKLVLNSDTGEVEFNYLSRTGKEIEIIGDFKSLKRHLEDLLTTGIKG